LPQEPDGGGQLRRFRDDPERQPLPTPSGKIEIFSETNASFQEPDCPGHPTWLTPVTAADASAPLILVAKPTDDAPPHPARLRRAQRRREA